MHMCMYAYTCICTCTQTGLCWRSVKASVPAKGFTWLRRLAGGRRPLRPPLGRFLRWPLAVSSKYWPLDGGAHCICICVYIYTYIYIPFIYLHFYLFIYLYFAHIYTHRERVKPIARYIDGAAVKKWKGRSSGFPLMVAPGQERLHLQTWCLSLVFPGN